MDRNLFFIDSTPFLLWRMIFMSYGVGHDGRYLPRDLLHNINFTVFICGFILPRIVESASLFWKNKRTQTIILRTAVSRIALIAQMGRGPGKHFSGPLALWGFLHTIFPFEMPYCARYRKVTIWARVQALLGENAVAEVPLVMPSLAAQATAVA